MISLLTTVLVSFLLAVPQAPSPQATPASDMATDVARLAAATTNEQRFEVLTAMLDQRKIPFVVDPVALDKPRGTEPRTEGRNVIVTIGGGADEVLIGAHYDAVRLPDKSLSKGAVDNAASSVILVRLAESLRGETLPFRVRIAWFDMEELGLVGSSQYLKRRGPAGLLAMINLDINAYGDTVLFGPSKRTENAALRRALTRVCTAEEVACVGFPQMPPGDDRPFTAAGVPTVSLAILPALEVHHLWLMMNGGGQALAKDAAPAIMRTIHTADDVEARVEPQAMETMLRVARALVVALGRR